MSNNMYSYIVLLYYNIISVFSTAFKEANYFLRKIFIIPYSFFHNNFSCPLSKQQTVQTFSYHLIVNSILFVKD